MKKSILIGGVLAVLGGAIALPLFAFAANGDLNITVTSELGYPVSGTGFAIWCTTGNATTTVAGVTTAAGTVTIASTTAGLGIAPYLCKNGDTIRLIATTTGYVSTTTYGTYAGGVFTGTYNGNAANTIFATTSYTLKVTAMTSENNTNVMPAGSHIMSFSSTTPATGKIIVASSTYANNAWYLAASSTGPTGGMLMATSSGYVNNYISNVVTSTSTQQTVAFDTATYQSSGATYATSSFLYGLKVVVADPMGNAVVPFSASYNGVATTSASSNGSTLYWAIPNAYNANVTGILNIIADGYLWATSTNTGFSSVTVGSTTQVLITMGNYPLQTTAVTVSTSTNGLSATLKLTSFNNELGGNIMPTSGSPFSASGALAIMSQHYNSTDGAWYVAATTTTGYTAGTLDASVNGYADENTATVITSTSTQYTFNVGAANGSTYNIAGLPFALKATVQNAAGTNISGVTVRAGNSYSISCAENGTAGVYYCVIPTSDTGTSAYANKTGYYDNSANYSARSANSSAQSTATIVLTVQSGGGGGGGGSTVSLYNTGNGYLPVTSTVTGTNQSVTPVVVTTVPGCPTGYVCKPTTSTASASTPTPTQTHAPSASLSAAAASISRRLNKGVSGNDVKALQVMLNSDPTTQIATTGAGSPGNETNYFGGLTQTAVQKFQVKYGVAAPGAAGYGQVGPMTKAMLLKVFGK